MEQEHIVTFFKRWNQRAMYEWSLYENKEKIFQYNPEIIHMTKVSEKEIEALRKAIPENVQKMLEIYI